MSIFDYQTMYNQNQLRMKNYLIPIIIISSFLFSNCNKDKAEPPFDPSLIPGQYSGFIAYYDYGYDVSNGPITVGASLIYQNCQYSISNIGGRNFNLLVKNAPILPSPSIDFTISETRTDMAYEMIYLENDPNYSKYVHGSANKISYNSYDRITFYLTIKKTMPDSVYFIKFYTY